MSHCPPLHRLQLLGWGKGIQGLLKHRQLKSIDLLYMTTILLCLTNPSANCMEHNTWTWLQKKFPTTIIFTTTEKFSILTDQVNLSRILSNDPFTRLWRSWIWQHDSSMKKRKPNPKGIPTGGAQYVNFPKCFSHPSLVIYFFATLPIKLKLGLQIRGNY